MVSGEICGQFVEVRLRNSSGDAQDFFPHRARLPCLEGGGTFSTTFRGSSTHSRSRAHDGGNYSGEWLRCLRLTVISANTTDSLLLGELGLRGSAGLLNNSLLKPRSLDKPECDHPYPLIPLSTNLYNALDESPGVRWVES
jgi:hypothetical protein